MYGGCDLDERDWDLQIDTNLKGPFLTAKFAVARMRDRSDEASGAACPVDGGLTARPAV